MKMSRNAVLVLFLAAHPAALEAQQFIGDFCWERQTGAVIQLGVTMVGNGHFQLNGRADTSRPGEVTPVVGTAEALGDRVFLVMHFTGEDDVRTWMGTARGVLNRTTLAGTIEILEVFHFTSDPDPTSAQVIHLPKEPLTPTACPSAP